MCAAVIVFQAATHTPIHVLPEMEPIASFEILKVVCDPRKIQWAGH